MTEDLIIRALAEARDALNNGINLETARDLAAGTREIEKFARFERRHVLAAAASELRFRLERKARELESKGTR